MSDTFGKPSETMVEGRVERRIEMSLERFRDLVCEAWRAGFDEGFKGQFVLKEHELADAAGAYYDRLTVREP